MISAGQIWDTIRSRKAVVPSHARIDDRRVLGSTIKVRTIVPNKHYFGILIDEVFLAHSREWWRELEPVVLSITEFTYGSTKAVLPFVVGRKLLGEHAALAPQEMIYRGISASGTHPFRGGKVASTVVLCKSITSDWARRLVALVESVSQAVPFAGGMAKFTKLAESVLAGIDSLFSSQGVTPLVGLRQEFDEDVGPPLKPGFYVLIDGSEGEYSAESLWVKDGALHHGADEDSLVPFRDKSFVLFSIRGTGGISDFNQLPQHQTVELIKKLAASTEDDDWRRAKAELLVLMRELLVSADLTEDQALTYHNDVLELAKTYRERAQKIGHLSFEEPAHRDALRTATRLLDLP